MGWLVHAQTARQLGMVIRVVQSETVFRWQRELVRRKWTHRQQGVEALFVQRVLCMFSLDEVCFSQEETGMPPRSIDTISVSHLDEAMDRLVWQMYMGRIARSTPITDRTAINSRRNHQIRARYEVGEGLSELAQAYGISKQRVWQIVQWTSG